MLDRELIENLYSSDIEVKRAAVYRLLFDRRHDLLDELKKAATFEKNEEMAVFMVQVCLTLENFPRDLSLERRIVELLQKEGGAVSVSEEMWNYLETHGNSQMLLAALGAMGDAIPPSAQEFIETCLTHPDPEIRAAVCQKAIKSGRPTHFAFVLNLITDPDPYVSQTAFMVIKNLPGDELSIILDYALGSPDEWVLDNIAPFLPLIINNAVRKVVAKVSYHKHPMIAKKAREALKLLDAIPFISKRKAEAEAAAAAEKKSGNAEDGAEGESEDGEKKLSLKEQMELKRQQQLEEERKRKEEEEAMEAELASVKPEELAELSSEIEKFTDEPGGRTEASDTPSAPLLDETDALAPSEGLAEQARVLDELEVDENELEKVLAESVVAAGKPADVAGVAIKAEEEEVIVLDPKAIDFEKAQAQFGQTEEPSEKSEKSPAEIKSENTEAIEGSGDDIEILVVDETNKASQAEVVTTARQTAEISDSSDDDGKGHLLSAASEPEDKIATVADKSDETSMPLSATQAPPAPADSEVRTAPVPSAPSEPVTQATAAQAPAGKESISSAQATAPTSKTTPPPVTTVPPASVSSSAPPASASPQAKAVSSPPPPTGAAAKASRPAAAPGARPVLPPEAREIAARYPSFLVDPFIKLFVPADHKTSLVQIGQVLDNLTAFLNLCYLQSCLFFAPESEMLARSIIDCIKGELVGPTALRCLHNFVLSMKQARGNPVFFTFSLAGVLSETSDANPLMMMRELKEYLREPVEPLEESIPQAIEGMTEILRGVKSIVNNLLVMKTPSGAKEPFADLSGPEAKILPLEKRPALDLPVGEVVLISRDGGEALGLFPYFKYARKKVVFARPSLQERNILLERLEIPVEEFE